MELKAGYLVEIESVGGLKLCMVQYSILDELVCSSPSFWVEVSCFNKDLTIDNSLMEEPIKVTRIWGRTYGYAAYDRSIVDRELIWERECKQCQNQN